MTITPIMLFCQEQILKRLYPDMSLNESKNLELWQIWCKLTRWEYVYMDEYEWQWIISWWSILYSPEILEEEIIWLPPTLSRVLSALGDDYFFQSNAIYTYWLWGQVVFKCERKLLNSNKTDATLFDQSEETILSIAKLLWYNW